MIERTRHGRKLLIASIGVAAVSYVACGGSTTDNTGAGGGSGSATAGNGNTGGSLNTGGGQIAVGNLMAYPIDSGTGQGGSAGSGGGNIQDAAVEIQDAAVEKAVIGFDVLVANLIAPPPADAKDDTK